MISGLKNAAALIAAYKKSFIAVCLAMSCAVLLFSDSDSFNSISFAIFLLLMALEAYGIIVLIDCFAERFAGISDKVVNFINAYKERIGLIALGHTFNAVFDNLYNYWLYIPVVAYYGPVKAYCILTVGDIIFSLLFIKFYDWAKKDWLGIETAKELKEELEEFGPKWIRNLSFKSKLGKVLYWPFAKISMLVLWAIKKGDVPAFFVISIISDPFITTVCLRKKTYSGMGKKEWFIFISSALVSNAWWTGRTLLIIWSVKFGVSLF